MLGEPHALEADYPELANKIGTVSAEDPSFASENKRYNAIDKEIRKLEMRDSPIKDEEMNQLKHDRAQLKDKLYQRLTLE